MKNVLLAKLAISGVVLGCAFAHAEPGIVKSVESGDTLNIEIGGTVITHRLFGVDAPEDGQTYFLEAKQFTTSKALGQTLEVEVVTTDEKGQPMARITLPEGEELNLQLVKTGHAWWDEPNAPKADMYQAANAEAIIAKAGLWGAGVPLAPWDYRLSNGIELASYKMKEEETPGPRDEEMKEEPKVLSAKGNEVYQGTFIDAGSFDPKVVDGLDPMSLVGKHSPRIATDASGNPVGLTADNISQLPYASQLGLQDGDIISSVNGINLNGGLPQIFSLVEQHRDNPPKSINVGINRGGKNETITINLP